MDRLNLALSLAVPTEGVGVFLGLGANAARLARRIGLMTAPLARMILRATFDAVYWACAAFGRGH